MFPSALSLIVTTTMKMLSYEELKKSGYYFRIHDDHSLAIYCPTTGFTADDPNFMVDGKPMSEENLELDATTFMSVPQSVVNHISHGYTAKQKPSRWIPVSKDIDCAFWESPRRILEVKISIIDLKQTGTCHMRGRPAPSLGVTTGFRGYQESQEFRSMLQGVSSIRANSEDSHRRVLDFDSMGE